MDVSRLPSAMAWEWNITIETSMSTWPFENRTKMAPVSEIVPLITVTDNEEPIQFDMTKLRESAAKYIRIATKHADDMRKARALILSKRGRVIKELNKRGFVKAFVLPSHEEA